MKIYITHCSAEKNASLKKTGRKVTPDRLYTTASIRRFMVRCKMKKVNWAIFSDLYGIWFPGVKHGWYEKDPDKVTKTEFEDLVRDFELKLQNFDEIWFYYNPGRFHRLYKKLLKTTRLKNKIKLFTHLGEIT